MSFTAFKSLPPMNHNYAMHVYLINKYYHDDGQKCAVKIEYTVCILHFVKSFIKPNMAKPNFFLLILCFLCCR